MSNIRLTFGKRLRKLREKKGISQEVLAYDAELDRTYISSVERGKRNISLENIEKLSVALDVKIQSFFADE